MSCASAGNCTAVGSYAELPGALAHAFMASEVNGTWHDAKEVPGLATLNQYGHALVVSMSCASAANCGAGGSYMDSVGHPQPFVVSAVNGTWHTAIEVPDTATSTRAYRTGQFGVVRCRGQLQRRRVLQRLL